MCPGDLLTYECTAAVSYGTTVWGGSAFNCPRLNNELAFLHTRSYFIRTKSCNNGDINPVYTRPLIRIKNWIKLIQFGVNTLNPD